MKLDSFRRCIIHSKSKKYCYQTEMNVPISLMDWVRYKQLACCGHVCRVPEKDYLDKSVNGFHWGRKKR